MGFYPSEGDVDSNGAEEVNLRTAAGAELLGQQASAASLPVVIASNQTAIPVSTEGTKQTYSAAFTAVIPPAAATDVFTILGSATKTIRVTRVVASVSTTAGSGAAESIVLIKRSTADSAGTSTTATLVPHDSTNAAATTVVRNYTANPTLGTAVGTMRALRTNAATAGGLINETIWEFGTRNSQSIVLRGTSEQLCVNLNGVTITGPVACFSVEWTEE